MSDKLSKGTLNMYACSNNTKLSDTAMYAKKLQKEIEQQKKVIKAMATWISNQDTDEEICKVSNMCIPESDSPEDRTMCIECIINHFKESEVKE